MYNKNKPHVTINSKQNDFWISNATSTTFRLLLLLSYKQRLMYKRKPRYNYVHTC